MTYLTWLRTQPCAICGCRPPCEAAHFRDGSESLGKKARDENALPLCRSCHREGKKSYHKMGDEAKFCEVWGLDKAAAQASHRRRWGRERELWL